MNSIEYQRELAQYDERIAFHKAKAETIEHEKARFILDVIKASEEIAKSNNLKEEDMS